MLTKVKCKAGRRDHHSRLVRSGLNDIVPRYIPEALFDQHIIRLVEIGNVHADKDAILRLIGNAGHIHPEPVCVLHADGGQLLAIRGKADLVVAFKAESFKGGDGLLRFERQDQRLKTGKLHD